MPSSIPANFRSAENVSVPSFSFRSLSLVSSWSGQLIVPVRLSPSFLIFKVDVRCCPPISYSHFHVPTGSTTLSSAAPARPQTARTNAIERIAFMIASEIVAQRKQSDVDRHPPLAAIIPMPRPVVRSTSAETGQLAAIARRVGTFSAAQPCERSLNNFIGVARFGRFDRSAQRHPWLRRSIRPKRARRPSDASVDHDHPEQPEKTGLLP